MSEHEQDEEEQNFDRARTALAAGYCRGLASSDRVRNISPEERDLLKFASRVLAEKVGVTWTDNDVVHDT